MSYTNSNVNAPTDFSVGDQFGGSSIDWQGNWMDQIRQGEGDSLARLPYQIGQQYNKIAQDGIYGKEGVDNIMGSVQRANLLRMRTLSKGLTQNQGRRLNPRSLSVQNAVMNKVFAPGMEATQQNHANLLKSNMESKMQGLQGMENIMRFMQKRHGAEWWKKAKKSSGGVLGFLTNALKVAQFIPGPQQPFVIGANAGLAGADAIGAYNDSRTNQSVGTQPGRTV